MLFHVFFYFLVADCPLQEGLFSFSLNNTYQTMDFVCMGVSSHPQEFYPRNSDEIFIYSTTSCL